MQLPHVEFLSPAPNDRLVHIDFRPASVRKNEYPDLDSRFWVALDGAKRNQSRYSEIVPRHFTPIFEHASRRVMPAFFLRVGVGATGESRAHRSCESPAVLTSLRASALTPICIATHGKRRYHSMSNSESRRIIPPFLQNDTRTGRSIRALYRLTDADYDFGTSRIESPTPSDDGSMENEGFDNNARSARIMEWGRKINAAQDHGPKDEQYRKCLNDPSAWYRMASMKPTLGYAPKD